MDINSLVSRLKQEGNNADFFKYADDRIKEYEDEKRFNTARTYANVIGVLRKSHSKVLFSDITPAFLDNMNSKWKVNGVSQSTRSQYMSVLRAVYLHALKKKVIRLDNPFTGISFSRDNKKKSSVTVDDIRLLIGGSFSKAQQLAVDMFLLSLYLMGANLVDILYLKHNALQDDFITYVRRKVREKTTIPVKVALTPYSAEIIKKYQGNRYLLSILDADDTHDKYMQTEINLYKTLKKVQLQLGVKSDLSIGRARNTWATIAYLTGATDTEVDFALAHNLNTISRQYADFSKLYDMVNAVNQKVIAYIRG
jgi:integrase